MDTSASTPPLRISSTSSKSLSAKSAQTSLVQFLGDFQERSSALNGGDNTVMVQLQKLSKALEEERIKRLDE
ncbi:hypothetical protein FA95DRAFT_650145 [Auriscalpium vulgare]|uniref:Uncharacterized protein n=1 Tax=Auriscalpium vulgare TaxID=40419 RepID=A0ACB8RCK7_9AGAM|nr:hypothetical protein FA95DRAFT_650145 [Auriscalpium vulgare]